MTDLRTTMTCPRCGAETTAKARGRPRKWCSDRCRKLASEEHRAAARGVIGLEIRDRIIERRIPEVVYRRRRSPPPSHCCWQMWRHRRRCSTPWPGMESLGVV